MRHLWVLFYVLLGFPSLAQPVVRKVLFLGNSYTYVNNLPLLTAAIAHSSGDSLFFDSYAPGGYTLGWQPIAHASDPVSLGMIGGNTWDFIVLQEQSQIPSINRLADSCMYPAAKILHDSIKSANPCARPLFYLTWGRRFGGVQCFTPNYCSFPFSGFDQMQDTLTYACKTIADSLNDWIAPVGEAWRYVINTTGMVLHDGDNSHPNLKGSYLAACVFYAVIFGKPTTGNGFTAGLSPDTAMILQQAADSVTFGYASVWNLNKDVPAPVFSLTTSADTVFTQNLSTNADSWIWDFGDGQTSAQFEPYHVYENPGTWVVKLRACNACYCDSASQSVTITISGADAANSKRSQVTLKTNDQDGTLCLLNYPGDGTLSVFDLRGRIAAISSVKTGIIAPIKLNSGLWLWTLKDGFNEPVAAGKLFIVY